MYSNSSTYRSRRDFITGLQKSKIDRFLRKIMLGALIVDVIILPVFYIKLSASLKITVPIVATSYAQGITSVISVGPATSNFMQLLTDNNFVPVVFKKITRHPFTGDGRMVILNRDNIQIFEYIDHHMAVKDALLFAEKYSTGSQKLVWKKNMHVYVNDNLVIFYMGTEKTILESLEQNAVAFLTKPDQKNIADVSKVRQ